MYLFSFYWSVVDLWCCSNYCGTLATSCEELTHWKRLWCWEGLGAGGEGDDRGWDGWMASLTRWTWVWVNSGSWWWTGRPGMLQFMGSQRVKHDWVIELNWVITTVQQSDSMIHTHTYTFFFIFFSIMFYHRILTVIPCAIQLDLVVLCIFLN